MRKKQILALLAMILFGAGALFFYGRSHAPTWPLAAVDATLHKTVAADSKTQIPRMERISGDLRGQRHPLLNKLSRALRREPLYPQSDEYLLRNGSDEVRVIIHSSNNITDSVEILPASPPSKLAERLRADLLAAHPGLRCSIKKL